MKNGKKEEGIGVEERKEKEKRENGKREGRKGEKEGREI